MPKKKRKKGKIKCYCPCCEGRKYLPTQAEMLLTIADGIMIPNGIIIPQIQPSDSQIAAIALAIAFKKRGIGFHFRAMVEEWDRFRIVQEMY